MPPVASTIANRTEPSKRLRERFRQPALLPTPVTPHPPAASSRMKNEAAAKVMCLTIM
jgi:hypothetical protein